MLKARIDYAKGKFCQNFVLLHVDNFIIYQLTDLNRKNVVILFVIISAEMREVTDYVYMYITDVSHLFW